MSREYKKNMESWAAGFRDCGQHFQAQSMIDAIGDKGAILKNLKKMGLPTYDLVVLGLDMFLRTQDRVLDVMDFPMYWVTMIPLSSRLPKITRLGLSQSDVLDFAHENAGEQENYDMLISEYENNVYGGNIHSKDGLVYLELIKGDQIHVAQGTVDAADIYRAQRDDIHRGFRYSVDDPVMRDIMWKTIQQIRVKDSREDGITNAEFMEGYFELALTNTPQRSNLRPIFLDHKTSPLFTNLRHSVEI
jgi:hypothetical protein